MPFWFLFLYKPPSKYSRHTLDLCRCVKGFKWRVVFSFLLHLQRRSPSFLSTQFFDFSLKKLTFHALFQTIISISFQSNFTVSHPILHRLQFHSRCLFSVCFPRVVYAVLTYFSFNTKTSTCSFANSANYSLFSQQKRLCLFKSTILVFRPCSVFGTCTLFAIQTYFFCMY